MIFMYMFWLYIIMLSKYWCALSRWMAPHVDGPPIISYYNGNPYDVFPSLWLKKNLVYLIFISILAHKEMIMRMTRLLAELWRHHYVLKLLISFIVIKYLLLTFQVFLYTHKNYELLISFYFHSSSNNSYIPCEMLICCICSCAFNIF